MVGSSHDDSASISLSQLSAWLTLSLRTRELDRKAAHGSSTAEREV